MRPRLSYFICTLPRSGSWLLSEALESTGIAGRPREFFQEVCEQELFKRWRICSHQEYLDKVLEAGATPNGVFGMKLHWYQFELMTRKLRQLPGRAGLSAEELVARLFPDPRYIWLRRRDKACQAVSYYRAIQTGVWWEIEGGKPRTNAAPARVLTFDFAAIFRLEKLLLDHDRRWQHYFAEHGISPLEMHYEQVVDHEAAVIEVLDYLGILPEEFLYSDPRLKKQADALSEEWVARYRLLKQTQETP